MDISNSSLTRRQALRVFGGGIGGAAILGATSGFLSPASARLLPVMTAELDKSKYFEGDTMTLLVTENVERPDRRRIKISDSAGVTWTKVGGDGRTVKFTAVAGPSAAGEITVTVALQRRTDGAVVYAYPKYVVASRWRPRFTGDRKDRVMLGVAVTDKPLSNLQWEQTMELLGASAAFVSVRRCFHPGWITKARIDTWADWAEAQGVYPVMSFKVPSNDWAGVAAGKYDNDLDLLCATLEARANAGRAPVCVAVHHEPAGDGDLAVWARMQEYLSNYFAPYTDVFCFTTISNGYDWGPHRGGTGEVEKVYPRSLIDTLNRNRHILGCDTYDSADPTRLSYDQYDRTSLKIEGFVRWARAQGVQRIGLGEFGCHDDVDLLRCWSIISANRDLFAYACHFNSGQNSRADWRMIPADYPPDPAVTSYRDTGGSAVSAARLAAGKRMFSGCVVTTA